jgi:DNA-binding FadR family transcriptional regulator
VRGAISAGSDVAGDQLPTERDLAGLLHVSHAVVREALPVLELSGVVVVRRGGNPGVFVAQSPPRPVSLALRTLPKDE